MEEINQIGEEVQKIQTNNKRLFIFPLLLIVLGISLLVFLSSNKGSDIKGTRTQSVKKEKNISTNKKQETNKSVIVKKIPTTIASEIFLEVMRPINLSTVNMSKVSISGKTVPLADVFINDLEIKADGLGNFSTNLALDEGENNIVVLVNDSDGNFAEQELVVNYEPE